MNWRYGIQPLVWSGEFTLYSFTWHWPWRGYWWKDTEYFWKVRPNKLGRFCLLPSGHPLWRKSCFESTGGGPGEKFRQHETVYSQHQLSSCWNDMSWFLILFLWDRALLCSPGQSQTSHLLTLEYWDDKCMPPSPVLGKWPWRRVLLANQPSRPDLCLGLSSQRPWTRNIYVSYFQILNLSSGCQIINVYCYFKTLSG